MQINQTYQKILVSSGSGICDIILATAMIRSLRLAYPNAVIDVLVTEGRTQILNGNPDISEVIESVRGRGILEQIKFIRKIWRKYDLAISAASQRLAIRRLIIPRNGYRYDPSGGRPGYSYDCYFWPEYSSTMGALAEWVLQR